MPEATPQELLRLARKAFPPRAELGEDERDVPGSVEIVGRNLELCSEMGSPIIALPGDRPRVREALYAALLVFAGECVEIDVEALQKLIENIDDTLRIALAVATRAGAWDPEARLIGNVRAADLLTLAQSFVGLHEQNAALLAERDRLRDELSATERALDVANMTADQLVEP